MTRRASPPACTHLSVSIILRKPSRSYPAQNNLTICKKRCLKGCKLKDKTAVSKYFSKPCATGCTVFPRQRGGGALGNFMPLGFTCFSVTSLTLIGCHRTVFVICSNFRTSPQMKLQRIKMCCLHWEQRTGSAPDNTASFLVKSIAKCYYKAII